MKHDPNSLKAKRIMNNTNSTEPIVPPMHSDPNLKEYRCPHCERILFRGNIKNLKMVCHHCHKMINADENELFRTDNKEISNE